LKGQQIINNKNNRCNKWSNIKCESHINYYSLETGKNGQNYMDAKLLKKWKIDIIFKKMHILHFKIGIEIYWENIHLFKIVVQYQITPRSGSAFTAS
jgi:hypothetical protein